MFLIFLKVNKRISSNIQIIQIRVDWRNKWRIYIINLGNFPLPFFFFNWKVDHASLTNFISSIWTNLFIYFLFKEEKLKKKKTKLTKEKSSGEAWFDCWRLLYQKASHQTDCWEWASRKVITNHVYNHFFYWIKLLTM